MFRFLKSGKSSNSDDDAGKVLDAYGDLLEKKKSDINDIDELPYPKDVIKNVLITCIKLAPKEEVLRNCYVLLADFQPLSAEQKQAAFETVDKNTQQIFDISDSIFYFAELGMQEVESTKLLKDTCASVT